MSRRELHTHRGHCQACGAVQAIECSPGESLGSGRIAKHGYKVTWGYFSGTCDGAGHPALEFDRAHLNATRKALLVFAIGQDTRARKLRAHDGMLAPPAIVTGSKPNPDYKGVGSRTLRMLDVETPWCDCTTPQRDRWYSSAAFMAETNAKHARSHRAFLHELAERVHGTEPQAVNRTARAKVEVGTEFERYGTKWRVIGEPCLRGMGRGAQYVRCARLGEQHVNPTLNTATMRVQDVRKSIEDART